MSKHSDYLLNRGRSHQDFTDIDNLDRATETFLKEQRKSLGHAGINFSGVMEQCKRALVFVVLGVIFATAIIGGIRFQYEESKLRDPETTQEDADPPAEEPLVTEPGQVIQDSGSDVSKTNAEGRLTTAPPVGTDDVNALDPVVTTEADDADAPDEDDDADDDAVPGTVVSAANPSGAEEGTIPSLTRATAYSPLTTNATAAPAVAQTEPAHINNVTQPTTTSRTTVTTRKTTTTTTTTTTTAATELARVIEFINPSVSNATEQNGVYTQTVSVHLRNRSEEAVETMTVRLYCPSSGGITRVSDNTNSCRVSYSKNYITVTINTKIEGHNYGKVELTVTSSGAITSCSVV